MEYGFKLNWEELSEDLREQKIDEFLAYLGPEETKDLASDPRYYAEEHIRAHFPIYF